MKKKDLKAALKQFKGQKVDDKLIAKIAQKMQDEIYGFLHDTSFEIWNAGCSHRLMCNFSGQKDIQVCRYDNPLHAEKEFVTLDGALNYMEEKD